MPSLIWQQVASTWTPLPSKFCLYTRVIYICRCITSCIGHWVEAWNMQTLHLHMESSRSRSICHGWCCPPSRGPPQGKDLPSTLLVAEATSIAVILDTPSSSPSLDAPSSHVPSVPPPNSGFHVYPHLHPTAPLCWGPGWLPGLPPVFFTLCQTHSFGERK